MLELPGGREFACELKEILRVHRPALVILLEPRINGDSANAVCRRMLGKTRWVRSEATGFSGGVWMLWDKDEFSLELKYHDKKFLYFWVRSREGLEWELTAVYAYHNPSIRKFLWGKLSEVKISRPWVLAGDFNCVLMEEECSSNNGASSCFRSWVEENCLLDVGFIGSTFTCMA